MLRKTFATVCLLAGVLVAGVLVAGVLGSTAAEAAGSWHDYGNNRHWTQRVAHPNESVTGVSAFEALGQNYIAALSSPAGIRFYTQDETGLAPVSELSLLGAEQAVVFDGPWGYVVSQPDKLAAFSFWLPASPLAMWTETLPATPFDVALMAPYLVIACGSDGLLVYDLSESFGARVGVVGSWSGDARQVQMHGLTAIVRGNDGLHTIDLSDPGLPVTLDTYPLPNTVDLAVDGTDACLAAADSLVTLDLSDPTHIVAVISTSLEDSSESVRAVALGPEGVHVATSDGLAYLDGSSGNIIWQGGRDVDSRGMVVQGDLLFQAAGDLGLDVWRLAEPEFAPAGLSFTWSVGIEVHGIVGHHLLVADGALLLFRDLNTPGLAVEHIIPPPPISPPDIFRVSVWGDILAILYDNASVQIVRLTPSGWEFLSSFATNLTNVTDMACSADVLAIHRRYPGTVGELALYDISDPSLPSQVGDLLALPVLTTYLRSTTRGFVAFSPGSSVSSVAIVVDVTDPAVPRTASLPLPARAYVGTYEDAVYIMSQGTLRSYGVSDINGPQVGRVVTLPDGTPQAYYRHFLAAEDFGYLIGGDVVFDLSDPLAPVVAGGATCADMRRPIFGFAADGYLIYGTSDGFSRFYTVLPTAGAGPPAAVDDPVLPVPGTLSLAAAPNPFNPRVVLEFELPNAAEAVVEVFDVRGLRVVRLAGSFAAGRGRMTWNGLDEQGRQVPSGVYLALLRSAGRQAVQKLVLAR